MKEDIIKGLEDAKAGRISELTTTLLEEEENKMKIAPEFFEDISLAANSLRDIDDLVKEISEEYEVEKDYVHHLIVKTRKEKKKLANRKGKMRTLKQLEKMWDEYCKASDINVTDDIQIQLNISEPRLKVGIFRGDKGMHFTEAEIKALVEVLDSL